MGVTNDSDAIPSSVLSKSPTPEYSPNVALFSRRLSDIPALRSRLFYTALRTQAYAILAVPRV